MIDNLQIKNFKSIRNLSLKCKKINIFIGEPNTGKSNILEALGVISHITHGDLSNFVRFEQHSNLFYDQNIENPVTIQFDDNIFRLKSDLDSLVMDFKLGDNDWRQYGHIQSDGYGSSKMGLTKVVDALFRQFKYYEYKELERHPSKALNYLKPSNGENLVNLILTRSEFKEYVSDLYNSFGYRLIIEQPDRRIRILKQQGDIFILFPYTLTADTIRGIIFYMGAIITNENSVIIFNEPESKAFPFYTKLLAESIALDDNNNQYFITTHNPYLLTSILEKTKISQVAINVVYMKDYETKIRQLTIKQKTSILDNVLDPFYNLNQFIPEKEG